MTPLLLVKFQLNVADLESRATITPIIAIVGEKYFPVAYPSLELADGALAADQGVGLDLLEADGQILDLDFQRLLDGLDFDNALLLVVEDLHGVLELGLGALVALVGHLWTK